ncbi:MAG: GHKL domain-containing protein, partial [Erysipelotrichaceae bacterium]|nr:GHKL domain-containing protein [Erysipelotrichaceae bacterium]
EKYEAGRRRREFTANVTHELKTPIQSIMASAELLENNLVQPEDQPRFCGYITRESKRLLNLINDIIRLSQLDESFEDQTETLHLKAILSEIICQNEMEISRRRLTVFQNLEDVCVQGNRRMWQEVFSNLLENAVKYNREEGSIDLNLKEQEGKAVFEIRDTGIGIASKDQDRVFERFFRVDKSHSKATGGTGLGLAIVQHSVQRMNGSIEMESELNKGTLIRVLVPAGAGQ